MNLHKHLLFPCLLAALISPANAQRSVPSNQSAGSDATAGSLAADKSRGAQSPAADDEAVVRMSPFEVISDQDTGYVAANTLSGSRLNTPLRDTPASISVMTSEFLSDIGAFDLGDAMKYAVNIEVFQDDDRDTINGNANFYEYQQYRDRGLPSSRSRNYFPWRSGFIPDEMAFVDRIEDSRGPNSVLFGIGSPGGIINTSTKQPLLQKVIRSGTFAIDRFGTKRATFDYNQPLNDRFAVRLNLVYNDTRTFKHFEFTKHVRGLFSAMYKISDRAKLRLDFEGGKIDSNNGLGVNLENYYLLWDHSGRPVSATAKADAAKGTRQQSTRTTRVTYIGDSNAAFDMRGTLSTTNGVVPGGFYPDGTPIGPGQIRDTSLADYSVNVGGPAQTRYSRYHILSLFFNQQLAKNTFLEVAFNNLKHDFDARQPRGEKSRLLGDPNQLYAGVANPHAGDVYLETQWYRIKPLTRSTAGRIALSQEFDAEKWGHYRFAALAEYDRFGIDIDTYDETWVDASTGRAAYNATTPEDNVNKVYRRSYPVEGDWGSYFYSGPEGPGGLLSNLVDPLNTGRKLSSAWIPRANPERVRYTQKSGMVVGQGYYFNDHLVVSGGLRRDELTERRFAGARDPNTNQFVITDNILSDVKNSGVTKTYGAVYHINPTVSLIYNWADNFSLPDRGRFTLPPSGEPGEAIPVPPPQGVGKDYGIGLRLLDGRIYAKATAYTTSSKNLSATAPNALRRDNVDIMEALQGAGYITQAEFFKRTDVTAVGGHGLFDLDAKGYEVQVTANLTRDWRFTASYSRTKAVQSNTFAAIVKWFDLTKAYLAKFPGNLPTDSYASITEQLGVMKDELDNFTSSDGTGKLGNRLDKVSLFTRYSFSGGSLRGLYIGGGFRHQGKMFVGTDSSGGKLWGNAFSRTDLLLGYKFHGMPRNRGLRLQLNVDNLFDERDPLIIRYLPNGGISSQIAQSPISWRLSMEYEF
ncbi:MAG: hypothetical protein KBA71_02885 [Opitutaceae bacterium]|nr:hypothetical protein [Opitutaceae bacterium]